MTAFRDKNDLLRGLTQVEGSTKQITTYQHLVQIDSRDCIGTESIHDSREAFYSNGGRAESVGLILTTTGKDVSPVIVTATATDTLKNGDYIIITNVQGNTVLNNEWKINNVTVSSFEINTYGNGNYAGGGQWTRLADNGFPNINNNTSTIIGNEMNIVLGKKLKAIKSIGLNVSIIPRDIIPIKSYFKDLYSSQIKKEVTYIPQEEKYSELNSYGFYTTCLSIFRTYDGIFSMPNQSTPPPYNLWNPPLGNWPLQPMPYTHQTVPTYRSSCGIVCSGYGVYDLNDWTGPTRNITELARKALLKTIVRPQSFNGIDYKTIIDACSTTSNNVYPYGYGNFQRFICGPGLHMVYQPGTSDSANPTVPSGDWPIAFPFFSGNVWGPYDTPGDRFQKFGLRDTIQDLFLNGDLDNIYGTPIVKDIKISDIMSDPDYGLNKNFVNLQFSNYATSMNLNILNSMRIVPNGFGASNIIAQGYGNPNYNMTYQSSGGIGPNSSGIPNAWSTTGIYGPVSITDPGAVGPLSFNLLTNGTIPQTTVSNLPGDNSLLNHRISWYDTGPNRGEFVGNVRKYLVYCLSNVPETNLVIQLSQFPRNVFVQSTNSDAGTSVFNVPIRLSPEISLEGGFSYTESLFPMLSQSSDLEYWGQQFLTPVASLDKINLHFFTYEGVPIQLEKMLSYTRRDTTNDIPKIRSRRFISLLFRAVCYTYVNVGLNDIVDKILGNDEEEEVRDFSVKASNYSDY